MKKLLKIVEVLKPDYYKGKLVMLTDDRFKWPSQSFWVSVAIDDNDKELLISSWKDVE